MPPRIRSPGSGTVNTQVLGIVIERVTNRTLPDLFGDRIWSKVGMEGDGSLALSPSGEVLNGGIFASRPRDMARYGILYTPSWPTVAREQVVSDTYFEKVRTSGIDAVYGASEKSQRDIATFGERESHSHAAYQWDVVFTDGDLYKAGRNGQCLYVSPRRDVVVVWFSTRANNTPGWPATPGPSSGTWPLVRDASSAL